MIPILIDSDGVPPAERHLAAASTAGGSEADGLLLPGAPPRALLLEPCAAGLVVVPAIPGVRVAGHAVRPGRRRLLRAGERVELPGHVLRLAAAAADAAAEPTRVRAAALLRAAARGEAAPAGAHLVVLTGHAAGARFALAAEQTIGRSRRATIRLPDSQVSRQHARVRVSTGGASIEDLGAKNGLTVNGVRVERRRPARLRDGDELGIGETRIAMVLPAAGAAGAIAAPRDATAGAPRAAPPRRAGAHGPVAAAALLAVAAAALALAAS